jgi:hypothetical protein
MTINIYPNGEDVPKLLAGAPTLGRELTRIEHRLQRPVEISIVY